MLRRSDPAPYAWLDDPSRPQGTVGVPTTVVIGLLLLAMGAFGAIASWRHDRAAAVVLGLIAVAGVYVVRMAVLRVAWRRRHPGIDPTVASTLDEGGPVFAQNAGGVTWRWVLFGTGVLVAAFSAVALVVAIGLPGTTGSRAIGLVVIAAFVLGGAVLARGFWPLLTTGTAHDAAIGLRPSRWGGSSRAAHRWRASLLVVGVALVLLGLASELAPLLAPAAGPAEATVGTDGTDGTAGPVALALAGALLLAVGALVVVTVARRAVVVHRALRSASHPDGDQQAK